MITPRILKGFRDFLPQSMIQKKELIKKLETIFENFGFSPIDTPALEYTEILLSKTGGETEKQVYRFEDQGGRDVALRFDLTVPLSRFVSQYFHELVFPFKAYHIAPVWRGENTSRGRYREFYQCDFDILGPNCKEADLEILLLIKSGLEQINAGNFKIHLNNRKILNAILKSLDAADKSTEILRAIDKYFKIGYDNVVKEITDQAGIKSATAEKILKLLNLENIKTTQDINNINSHSLIEDFKKEIGSENENIQQIEFIFDTLNKMKIDKYYVFNPAITRGLDYYTGIVFESFILDSMNFGSVCSGGRYENLNSLFSKNVVPGVGASFGLDRIIGLLEDKKLLNDKKSNTDLIIFNLDSNLTPNYQLIAEELRKNGIKTEVFLQDKKINAQFKYAEKKSINYVLFAGEEEINNKKYNLKNLTSKEEIKDLKIDEIIEKIK